MVKERQARKPSHYWLPLYIDPNEHVCWSLTYWVSNPKKKQKGRNYDVKKYERKEEHNPEGRMLLFRRKKDAEKWIRSIGETPSKDNLIKLPVGKEQWVKKEMKP